MKYFYFFFILISILSCQSIKNNFEKNDYEKVVSIFIQKKQNKKISDEDIALFEKAYQLVLENDKKQIVSLKSINNGERWEQIFDVYTRINNRQNSIIKIWPILNSRNEEASIELFDLSAALEESRQNSAQYYYDQGLKLLNSGNKNSIRQSVDYFIASKKFYINYKDVNELIDQAQQKGKNYVLLVVDKNPYLMLPPAFEQSILDNVKMTQQNNWLHINYRKLDDIKYDYVVQLNLYDIKVSPDVLKEYNTTEEKTISDGWQYVLDERGNVKKDSLGNDIKIPKYKKITCQVRETRMSKTAQVFGDVTIYDAQQNDYIKSQKCIGNADFQYSYFQYNGDKNALSQTTLNKLGNQPTLFPTTFEMVERSKSELIKCYQDFISKNYKALTYTN